MARKRITEIEREIMRDIAFNLQRILKSKTISQKELSEITGISQSTISDYVNAKTLATPSIVQLMAEKLNVPAKEIQSSLDKVDTSFEARKIPLVGTICAGDGFLAEQYVEDYIHFPFENKRQPDYALRVKGNSMINAGIEDGDVVYLRRASWAERNGQVVAAIVNGEEGTLKRMKWSGSSPMITLQPENDDFQIIEVMPNEITVCGIYMGHFKMDKEE